MNRIIPLALVAAAALAGCNKQSHTIVAGSPDNQDNAVVNAAAVQLPPAIEASKSYRCKDNSVVYIDWLNDKKTADIRATKTGEPTRVTATEAGKAMTAAGYSLTGDSTAEAVTVERPGKGSQSCKA
ncbi:MAG: hypothetical protein ABR588_04155 [Sphingomicrobium sp.]|nr:hypothetical protein [Sphingomonadales bacterium]